MFFIIAFFVAGGLYAGLSRASNAIPLIAVTAILGTTVWYILMAFVWVNDALFITPVINESLQFLSGVEVYGRVEGQLIISENYCSGDISFWSAVRDLSLLLVLFVLSIVLIIPGVAALVLTPIGLISAVGGAIIYLFNRDKEYIRFGLVPLIIALGCILAAGLIGRLIHTLSVIQSCA